MSIDAQLRTNIELMSGAAGFDVVVVCTGNEKQAAYWQARLESVRGTVVTSTALLLAVHEDWPGGAGNALGTLYAWQNAAAQAKSRHGVDLMAQLSAKEISVALYHTAGKGTRLAPLPASENNNKPGVKLAVAVAVTEDVAKPLTILEGVIKQTGTYGPCRKGRLSVFWGDQVFVPSVAATYTPSHHADILCTLGPMPTAEVWQAKGLDKYGLIAVNQDGNAAQVEKVSHATAERLLSSLGAIKSVGASLGSFSVSSLLLEALHAEFDADLAARSGKLDSDPHLWMPMTLEQAAYVELMGQKGVSAEEANDHFARVEKRMKAFWQMPGAKEMGLFGAVDVGTAALWWDYGQLPLYRKNNMLLIEDCAEAEMLRMFLGVSNGSRVSSSTVAEAVAIDGASVVSNSTMFAGSVQNSVLSGVRCNYVEADGAILVNVVANRITALPGSIIYNVTDRSESGVCVAPGGVMVGVHAEDGSQKCVWSAADVDGGKAWKQRVKGNASSFEDIYNANAETDVAAVDAARTKAADAAWKDISP